MAEAAEVVIEGVVVMIQVVPSLPYYDWESACRVQAAAVIDSDQLESEPAES